MSVRASGWEARSLVRVGTLIATGQLEAKMAVGPMGSANATVGIQSTIHHAERLIAEGRRTFTEGGRVEPAHFSTIEYYVVYQEAIDLLLREGFIEQAVPALQEAFFGLIPAPSEYVEEAWAFEALGATDVATRVKAASRFDELARFEASVYRRFLFQYPRTFERLIPALGDGEPKVVILLIRALGCGAHRYFLDPRVFEAFLPLLDGAKAKILETTVLWSSHFRDERKYEPLLRRLAGKPNQPLLRALCRHFGKETPTASLAQAQHLLVGALDHELNAETRSTVLATLVKSQTPETIPALQASLRLEERTDLAKDLRRSMRMYLSTEERAWMEPAMFGTD